MLCSRLCSEPGYLGYAANTYEYRAAGIILSLELARTLKQSSEQSIEAGIEQRDQARKQGSEQSIEGSRIPI